MEKTGENECGTYTRKRKTSLFDSVQQPTNEGHDKGIFVMAHADFPKGKPRSWTIPGQSFQIAQNESGELVKEKEKH